MGKLAHPTNLYTTLGSKLGHEGGAETGGINLASRNEEN